MKIDKKAQAALGGKGEKPFRAMTAVPTHDGKFAIHHHKGSVAIPHGQTEMHIAENKEQLAQHIAKHANKMEPMDVEDGGPPGMVQGQMY